MSSDSHVSMSEEKILLGVAEEATSYRSSTSMIYIGAPQNTRRKTIEEMNVDAGKALMAENGPTDIVIHAPYIINLGNMIRSEILPFAVRFLKEEIVHVEVLDATQIALHPGVHVGMGAEAGVTGIIKGLNEALTKEQTTQITLEMMIEEGIGIGWTFKESAQITDRVKLNEKLSVTFDTYHTNDAEYNIKEDSSDVVGGFDKVIRLDWLKVLHINDSKNPQGSYKDRRTNINFETVGFDALDKIIHDPMFGNIPKILGTLYVGKDKKKAYVPYGRGISVFKARAFDSEVFPELLAEEVTL